MKASNQKTKKQNPLTQLHKNYGVHTAALFKESIHEIMYNMIQHGDAYMNRKEDFATMNQLYHLFD